MKFKIDENLPEDAAEVLHQAGFAVDTVREEGLAGSGDPMVARVAQEQDRTLITLDSGFGEIRAYPPDKYAGILVLRPRSQDKPTVLALLKRLLMVLRDKSPARQLWIVEPDRIRYR